MAFFIRYAIRYYQEILNITEHDAGTEEYLGFLPDED